jgi:hypothetical protein
LGLPDSFWLIPPNFVTLQFPVAFAPTTSGQLPFDLMVRQIPNRRLAVPLLDHFHPPLSEERHWEGFHSKWANVLVDELNEELLPPGYFAEPHVHTGPRVEIDAATFERNPSAPPSAGNGAAARDWSSSEPTIVMPAVFADTFEVQVINTEVGPVLVAAIELISPANKDRAEHRRAFAVKCASYLNQGISLILVDIVTSRQANLHDEMVQLLPDGDPYLFPAHPLLYATAYRPIRRSEGDQIGAWLVPLAVGQPLPVLPLALSGELSLPINLESTYVEACQKLRLIEHP